MTDERGTTTVDFSFTGVHTFAGAALEAGAGAGADLAEKKLVCMEGFGFNYRVKNFCN